MLFLQYDIDHQNSVGFCDYFHHYGTEGVMWDEFWMHIIKGHASTILFTTYFHWSPELLCEESDVPAGCSVKKVQASPHRKTAWGSPEWELRKRKKYLGSPCSFTSPSTVPAPAAIWKLPCERAWGVNSSQALPTEALGQNEIIVIVLSLWILKSLLYNNN